LFVFVLCFGVLGVDWIHALGAVAELGVGCCVMLKRLGRIMASLLVC
jgi:hypothetical protein